VEKRPRKVLRRCCVAACMLKRLVGVVLLKVVCVSIERMEVPVVPNHTLDAPPSGNDLGAPRPICYPPATTPTYMIL